jgi:hypothetical protein
MSGVETEVCFAVPREISWEEFVQGKLSFLAVKPTKGNREQLGRKENSMQ